MYVFRTHRARSRGRSPGVKMTDSNAGSSGSIGNVALPVVVGRDSAPWRAVAGANEQATSENDCPSNNSVGVACGGAVGPASAPRRSDQGIQTGVGLGVLRKLSRLRPDRLLPDRSPPPYTALRGSAARNLIAIDLPVAVDLAVSMTQRRTPEPLRRARQLARRTRNRSDRVP